MRTLQFWTLVLISTLVSGLMIRQIFISRQLRDQQRVLMDNQAIVAQGESFETAWKQIAMGIFQAGRQDPALTDVLKDANVQVRQRPTATNAFGPAPTPQTAPVPTPAKATVGTPPAGT